MKTTSLMFFALLPATLFAGEVKPGDKLDYVLTSLGEPRGRAQAGGRELLCFERGDVELTAGVVTRVALRSEEAQAEFAARRTAELLRASAEQETRRVQLTAEGTALKASKLADHQFQSAPPRYQVEFWRNFASRYSTVSCTEQLGLAQARLHEQEQTERIRAAEAQRLAELAAAAASPKIYYPLYFDHAYGYGHDRSYHAARRQQRLDREYHERTRHHESARDCRSDRVATTGRSDGKFQNGTAANSSLLAAGQNVMTWDGTKMPGGEAAGLYR